MENINYGADRSDTSCIKWDMMQMAGGKSSDLPFWIADMEFSVAECIQKRLADRLRKPVFGYTYTPMEYKQAISGWYKRRHDVNIDPSEIIAVCGTLPAMVPIVEMHLVNTKKVLVFTPVYPNFFGVIEAAGGEMISYPMGIDREIEWDKVDALLKEADVLLFCNPHNPTARVWKEEDLKKIAKLCIKNNVIIVSDEVHGDWALFGNTYRSFISCEEALDRIIVITAPAKTFNIAGISSASIFIKDAELRDRVSKNLSARSLASVDLFSMEAALAAYSEGDEWLDNVKAYVTENFAVLESRIKENMPLLSIEHQEGTFLAWIDAGKMGEKSEEFICSLEPVGGILADNGRRYGEGGEGFIRMNIACSKELLGKGLDAMEKCYREILK